MAEAEPVAGPAPRDTEAPTGWNPAELLDIDVDELAGSLPDIAHRQSGQAVGVGQATRPVAAQHAVHGRTGMTQERAEPMRADAQSPASQEEPADLAFGQPRGWRWGRDERP